ncbi:MAG: hypothetical protein B7Z15_11090, partial [Rhizobiales bacterium 32-66-8]
MVREIAGQVRSVMASDPAVLDPHLNWGEQVKSITLEVDQDRARAIGTNPGEMAETLQTLLSGYTVTQHREGNLLINVVARAVPEERVDLEKLAALTVSSANGIAVPLGQVARIAYVSEEPILWRRDRDLVLTVRGDVIDGVQPPTVTTRLLPQLDAIKASLPAGYRIETGGSIEESAKANKALAAVFPIMIVVMLSLLMIQLQSFSRLFLVLVTAPLGLIVASGLFAFFLSTLSSQDFLSWGWRYPFFVAFAINVVALFARLRLVATPEFERLFESRELQPAPFWETVREEGRTIVLGAFAPLASFALFHLVTVFPLSWVVLNTGEAVVRFLVIEIVGAAVCVLSILASGVIADIVGRRAVLGVSAVLIGAYSGFAPQLLNGGSFGE